MAITAVLLGQKRRWELIVVLPPPPGGLNNRPDSVAAGRKASISDESVVSRGKRANTRVGQVGKVFNGILWAIHEGSAKEVMLLVLPVEGVVA